VLPCGWLDLLGRGGPIFKSIQADQVRRYAVVTAKLVAVAGLLVTVAVFSAYYTVRHSVVGRNVEVPDLSGLTSEEASALLEKKGLVLEEAARRNDQHVEIGRVIAQDPAPGAAIKPERKVKVIVSLGDKVSSIPELRGGAARKAQITLQQQGMKLGDQVYVHSGRAEENMVIGQDPLPEGAGLQDAKVALLVSSGVPPRTYVMPRLAGRGENEAVAFLSRAGLKVGPVRREPRSDAPPGTVVAQEPESGYPVRSGDLITLTVAGGGPGGG
jgi:serine/threonine-protein kinase